MDVSKILEIFKVSGWNLTALAVATGLVLFLPESSVKQLGLGALRAVFKPWIGAAFILSSVLAVTSWARRGWEQWSQHRVLLTRRDAWHNRLRNLPNDEKQILRQFMTLGAHNLPFHLSDGSVLSLVAKRVLHRPSQVIENVEETTYILNTWARDFLTEHPEVLN
ncbi:MAG TPA: super-infection exclusion protein B [Candidatus Saccharimonadaceae bacterium]|jgi:hypothetical protein|nr:super-infection exclusion protein B [Candidatus Saccharimonadaceae bacterium]